MLPDEADRAFLWDVLEAARSIQALVSGMAFEQFTADRRTYRAVERELEIMGEAARSISNGFRAAHPEVPWGGIIGSETCSRTSMAEYVTTFCGKPYPAVCQA
jgi:uncharacterized protein with HEPN domain